MFKNFPLKYYGRILITESAGIIFFNRLKFMKAFN